MIVSLLALIMSSSIPHSHIHSSSPFRWLSGPILHIAHGALAHAGSLWSLTAPPHRVLAPYRVFPVDMPFDFSTWHPQGPRPLKSSISSSISTTFWLQPKLPTRYLTLAGVYLGFSSPTWSPSQTPYLSLPNHPKRLVRTYILKIKNFSIGSIISRRHLADSSSCRTRAILS